MSNGFDKLIADDQAFKLNVVESLAELKGSHSRVEQQLTMYIEANNKSVSDCEMNISDLKKIVTGNGKPEDGMVFQLSMLKKYWLIFTGGLVFILYFVVDIGKSYIGSLFHRGN